MKVLDQLYSQNDPFLNERAYKTDKTLVYVRLSRLEKKLGNNDKSKEYMDLALSYSKKVGWKNWTQDRLLRLIGKLDRDSMFDPLIKESTTR